MGYSVLSGRCGKCEIRDLEVDVEVEQSVPWETRSRRIAVKLYCDGTIRDEDGKSYDERDLTRALAISEDAIICAQGGAS